MCMCGVRKIQSYLPYNRSVLLQSKISPLCCRLLFSKTTRNVTKNQEEKEEADNKVNDNDDDMSGDEQHDGDASAQKAISRHDEENEYEGEEEEKEEIGESESGVYTCALSVCVLNNLLRLLKTSEKFVFTGSLRVIQIHLFMTRNL